MNCRIMKTESDEQIQDSPEDIPMAKELSEMSLEELWTLFPIILVPHDDRWHEYYNDMRKPTESMERNISKSRFGGIAVEKIGRTNCT